MKEKGHYVPPRYIPLKESEEADTAEEVTTTPSLEVAVSGDTRDGPKQWSSGICACFDDIQSCTLLSVLQTFDFTTGTKFCNKLNMSKLLVLE